MPPQQASRLRLVDSISMAMDAPSRPLNFAFVGALAEPLTVDALRRGADSAMLEYPVSGCIAAGRLWRQVDPAARNTVTEERLDDTHARDEHIGSWLDAPFTPKTSPPVRQRLFHIGDDCTLATQFHHAAVDGVGACLWLGHQLAVATGARAPTTRRQPIERPTFRPHTSTRRNSRFAFETPASGVSPGRDGADQDVAVSHKRRWHTVVLDDKAARTACEREAFSYNDLLCACILDTLRWWNSQHGGELQLGLWLPVNIRAQADAGFGNASSRIRVYDRAHPRAAVRLKCAMLREQIRWARRDGEWVIPDGGLLDALPLALLHPLMRAVFNRPGVDMGSAVFTHVERWPGEFTALGNVFRTLAPVVPMDPSYPVGFGAITLGGNTSLTLTYDPHRMTRDDARTLGEYMRRRVSAAAAELLSATVIVQPGEHER